MGEFLSDGWTAMLQMIGTVLLLPFRLDETFGTAPLFSMLVYMGIPLVFIGALLMPRGPR
jgi:hypothetical protein